MSERPTCTGEFSLGVDDYVAFAVFAATQSRFRRRTGRRVALFGVGPLAVALDLAVGFHPGLYDRAGGVPGLVALALIIGALLVSISALTDPLMIRLAARRRFRDGSFVAFTKPQTIEISTAGVRVTGGAGDGLTPWSSIVDLAVGPDAGYLFLNSLSGYLVPRRAFTDAAGFDAFLARARELQTASRRGIGSP